MSVAVVRPMRAGDAAAVARLSGELGYPVEREDIQERFARLAEDPGESVFVACDRDEQVRGWLHVSAGHDLTSPVHAEVRGLVVDGPFRGRGIGRSLLEAAEEWAAAHGCRAVRVRSNTLRERARSFYEGAGYAMTKTQYHFKKPIPEAR